MKKRCFSIAVILFFVLLGGGWTQVKGASTDAQVFFEEKLPLSMAEAVSVVSEWLAADGARYSRNDLQTGSVRFKALKNSVKFQVLLQPRSALATLVRIQTASGAHVGAELAERFREHLSGAEPASRPNAPVFADKIPDAVAAQLDAVVCITANGDGEAPYQATGFLIDTQGLIVCTAHNLSEGKTLSIYSYSRRAQRGRVIKIDSRLDLALIRTEHSVDTAVPIAKGRNLLGIGEQIYTIGCPNNLPGTVYGGVVNAPPRKTETVSLWQVNLEIHPGSSGSPVFDGKGNLVGVIKGRYVGTETVGFIIPYEALVSFLSDAVQGL